MVGDTWCSVTWGYCYSYCWAATTRAGPAATDSKEHHQMPHRMNVTNYQHANSVMTTNALTTSSATVFTKTSPGSEMRQ